MRRFCAQISICTVLLSLMCCSPGLPASAVESGEASISPDYKDVTIPCNIAPMSFIIRDKADSFVTVVCGEAGKPLRIKGRAVKMDIKKWKALLEANKGDSISFQIYEKTPGGWKAMKPFRMAVAEDPVDEYLSYRLIAPTYGMAGEMSLVQRRLTDFREREIFNNMMDYDRSGGQCVNCHSFQAWGTDRMQFHVRQKDGGTIIVDNGTVRKTNLKRDGILSAGVYPSWHPTENLIAYSVNSTYQNFFSTGKHKTEVIDNASDLILYDVEADLVIPVLSDSLQMETFPYWSPDGETLFFCQASLEGITKAAGGRITDDYDKVHYNLMRMGFNPSLREFSAPEVVFDAAALGKSATLPRLSPDGKHLLFTLGDFGNFHIWHEESDLWLMDWPGGEVHRLDNVNSDDTESYHSWSSEGRWIVFSTRRDDGLYTRLYLSYFDGEGRAHKPFIIPQKDPTHNLKLYKSYNIPEFTTEPVRQHPKDFLRTIRKKPK